MQQKTRNSATLVSTVATEDYFSLYTLVKNTKLLSPFDLCHMKPSSRVILSVHWEIVA